MVRWRAARFNVCGACRLHSYATACVVKIRLCLPLSVAGVPLLLRALLMGSLFGWSSAKSRSPGEGLRPPTDGFFRSTTAARTASLLCTT